MGTEYCKEISVKCPYLISCQRNSCREKIKPIEDQRVSERTSSSNQVQLKEYSVDAVFKRLLGYIKFLEDQPVSKESLHQVQSKKYSPVAELKSYLENIKLIKDQHVSEGTSSSHQVQSNEYSLVAELISCLTDTKSTIDRRNDMEKVHRKQINEYLEKLKFPLEKDKKDKIKKELKEYVENLKSKEDLDEIISIKSVLVQTIEEDSEEEWDDYLFELIFDDYSDNISIQLRSNYRKAENVLNLIYRIGLKKVSFTEKDKETIGNLLADTIEYLQVNIENTANVYRTRLSNSVLRKRSAVQFLLDNYSQFPVGNSTLADKFREVNFKESAGILDDIISRWRDVTVFDESSSYRESADANEVPEFHTWWLK